MKVLGIDIGGTGIKGAVVDTSRGVFKTDRLRILTPHPATPDAVADVVDRIVRHFDWEGPVGFAFPGVVKHGTIHTAANLDATWVGLDGGALFSAAAGGLPVTVLNDADAAGRAEMAFGAGKEHGKPGRSSVVVMVTLGTGIGTAVFTNGQLVPNTELGHLELHGGDAERYAAESVRETQGLRWEEWAARVDEYLRILENLLWPDLIVIGGGVSKQADQFLPLLTTRTPVVPARLRNRAGIIGAALAGATMAPPKQKRLRKR
ncbi:MAG: ROK family protein [Acidimicrobiales bacterium]|nr:ROK family protein [Acidimicrobiales bacterium]